MANKKNRTNPHKNVTILYSDKLDRLFSINKIIIFRPKMYLELKDTSMLLKTTFRSELKLLKKYENVRRHRKKTKTFAKDKRALCEVRERTRSSSRFDRLKNEKKNVDEARSSVKNFYRF